MCASLPLLKKFFASDTLKTAQRPLCSRKDAMIWKSASQRTADEREEVELRNVQVARIHSTETSMRSGRRSTEGWRMTERPPIQVLIVESHTILREGLATI